MPLSKTSRTILIATAALAAFGGASSAAAASDHTVVHFDDLKQKPGGKWRGNGVLQADTRLCSPNQRLDYESWQFKQCMLGRGWRYSWTEPGTSRGSAQTWQERDEDGTLLTCHSGPGGFGAFCSNF